MKNLGEVSQQTWAMRASISISQMKKWRPREGLPQPKVTADGISIFTPSRGGVGPLGGEFW